MRFWEIKLIFVFMKASDYSNPYGTWKVTTEGDVEGRSPNQQLGTYTGFLDEIAFALADKQLYSLSFSLTEPITMLPKRKEVSVSLDISSGTWGKQDERVKFFENMLKGRPNVFVKAGQYYASVILTTNQFSPEELARQKAWKKLTDALTPEEIELLRPNFK